MTEEGITSSLRYSEFSGEYLNFIEETGVTNERNKLNQYLKKINSFPILTKLEEEKLLKSFFENNDVQAIHKVLNCHLRLVVKIAMSFKTYKVSLFDLIAEGNLGLLKAAKNFSIKKKVRFSTYAMLWIKASIQEFIIKTMSIVKIGTTSAQKRIIFGLSKVKRYLGIIDNDSYNKQSQKVAKMLNVKHSELETFKNRCSNKDISLSRTAYNEEGKTMEDIIESPEFTSGELAMIEKQNSEQIKQAVQQFISTLSEREAYIINSRKLSDPAKTLASVASKLNISIERVRQIESSIIKKLKFYILTKHSQHSLL